MNLTSNSTPEIAVLNPLPENFQNRLKFLVFKRLPRIMSNSMVQRKAVMDEILLSDKARLRRSLLQARQTLTVETWRTNSDRLCEHLAMSPLFEQAQTVLAYFGVRQEPELSLLFSLDKTWGFPRCVGKSLTWHHWSPQSSLPLQLGAYGIPEPDPACLPIAVEQVDLLLVPAIACDRRGYRLGYGGGFYDRLLSAMEWADIPTIGIMFDFGKVSVLPNDSWDRPLSAICTESGFYWAENF
jgi:5-formyltetrahydrofolate cyclo-ligase